MRKLLSTKYSAGAFSAAMLILRLGLGIFMMHHGYQKLIHFGDMQAKFMNFMGIGSSVSLALLRESRWMQSLPVRHVIAKARSMATYSMLQRPAPVSS